MAHSSDKPNVLFIISDQHNRRIAGFAGNGIVQTPNLDRLASEAVQFDSAYCQFPLCTPSRISMWTGRLPHRCGGWKNALPIFPELTTIPEHFQTHGYITCGIGKMHIGGENAMNGFMYRPYGDLKCNEFCGHQPDPIYTARDNIWTSHRIGHFPYAGESEIPESLMQETVVTRETLSFIRDHTSKHPERPWFVCASYARPHHPLTAPGRLFRRYWPNGPQLEPLPNGFPDCLHPHDRFIVEDYHLLEFSDEQKRRGLAAYYASVQFLDECIGDLLLGLESQGLLNNTVVIYTSDHGDLMSEHGLWWKRSYYDGSVGVPLLIRTPDRVRRRITEPVELLDLFPTLSALCGLPPPDELDGEDLTPLIEDGTRRRNVVRSEHLARPETTFRMVRTSRWKYVEFPDYPPVLFDMIGDPAEELNLATDSSHDGIVSEMRALLWEDGESWDSLYAQRKADLERAGSETLIFPGRTPNQYALPNGAIVDAETMLYASILEGRET